MRERVKSATLCCRFLFLARLTINYSASQPHSKTGRKNLLKTIPNMIHRDETGTAADVFVRTSGFRDEKVEDLKLQMSVRD